MKRYGQICKIKPEGFDKYVELHNNPWPEIPAILEDCNLRNYSIFFRDGFLFCYFEYIGSNFQEDMKRMAGNPAIQKWWDLCKPCMEPLETRVADEWWANMAELYHQD